MALAEPIKLRLTVEQRRQYEDEATARNMELGPYIRHRLDQGDQVAGQLAALRSVIEDGFSELRNSDSAPRPDSSPGQNPGLLIEAILLLRSVVGQDKLGVVHGELKRQGLPIWTGDKGAKK
jgi:hypothetical protein